MKQIPIAAIIGALAASASPQSPPQMAPQEELEAPRSFEQPPEPSNSPKEAPPGKFCLLRAPARCDQSAPQIIREPFSPGEVDLYMLEKEQPKAPAKTLPAPPHR